MLYVCHDFGCDLNQMFAMQVGADVSDLVSLVISNFIS
jgi:hypothetical protein